MNLKEFYWRLISVFLFFSVFVFSSCTKDETRVFDQSPDTRINEALAQYGSALTGSAGRVECNNKDRHRRHLSFPFPV